MILITSGCSFSECISDHIDTWPLHLQKFLDCEHHSCALGSQGNGLIMRKALYKCNELLKNNDPQDLLVGIMWSGPARSDFYSDAKLKFENSEGWQKNPTSFIPYDKGGWVIMNHHWNLKLSKIWYENYYNSTYAQWQTLEYILHTQWYLEKHNIKYFMMCYTNEVFPIKFENHSQLKWMYEQVNFSKFISKEGCMEWCKKYGTYPVFLQDNTLGFHPTTEQHSEYTQKVIIPYLQENNLI